MVGARSLFAWEQVADARRGAQQLAGGAVRQFHRRVQGRTDVSMESASIHVEGLRLNYAVSSNDEGPDQVWAVNIHGYFAGGAMYHRESEHLAESLGWRVVNPSLPGFGGSDPLSWSQISMASLARRVEAVLDHLGVDQAVLLGHSMGGGVAIEFAARHPERVLGIIYRDGAATPAWHDRHGLIPLAMSSVAPDLGPMADLVASVMLDIPDLLMGRMLSTLRSVLPDLRRNLKTLARTAPVASMLMEVDQTPQVVDVRRQGIPLFVLWGCFDRITTAATAEQFSSITGAQVLWVPGGHSWMLARPGGQRDVLRYLPEGASFLSEVDQRRGGLGAQIHPLRSIS